MFLDLYVMLLKLCIRDSKIFLMYLQSVFFDIIYVIVMLQYEILAISLRTLHVAASFFK